MFSKILWILVNALDTQFPERENTNAAKKALAYGLDPTFPTSRRPIITIVLLPTTLTSNCNSSTLHVSGRELVCIRKT